MLPHPRRESPFENKDVLIRAQMHMQRSLPIRIRTNLRKPPCVPRMLSTYQNMSFTVANIVHTRPIRNEDGWLACTFAASIRSRGNHGC